MLRLKEGALSYDHMLKRVVLQQLPQAACMQCH